MTSRTTTSEREAPRRTRDAVLRRPETAAEPQRQDWPTDSPRWWRDALRRRLLAMADITAAGSP